MKNEDIINYFYDKTNVNENITFPIYYVIYKPAVAFYESLSRKDNANAVMFPVCVFTHSTLLLDIHCN